MKLIHWGLPLVALLMGAGCGRTEMDLHADDGEGPAGAGGGMSSGWAGGVGGAIDWSTGAQAGNPGPGAQGGHAPLGGMTMMPPPGGAITAGAPSSQGGIRGGTSALPPPGGARPPVAGNIGGTIWLTATPYSSTPYVAGSSSRGGYATGGVITTPPRGGASGGAMTTNPRGGASSSSSRAGAPGGTSAVAGSSGSSACPTIGRDEDLIDDMNDGNRYIPTSSGRAGAWNVSHDASPEGTMFPASSSAFTMSETGDPCRKKAVHTYGSLFVEWGSNVWVSLGSPYNAIDYRGISFWAKVDEGASTGLRVAFPDKDTQPEGGLCQASVGSGPAACFDHYGKRIILTTEWKRYTVLFDEIAQERWGRQGTAFDPTSLYEVLFQISATAKFGLWIDDVVFLRPPVLY